LRIPSDGAGAVRAGAGIDAQGNGLFACGLRPGGIEVAQGGGVVAATDGDGTGTRGTGGMAECDGAVFRGLRSAAESQRIVGQCAGLISHGNRGVASRKVARAKSNRALIVGTVANAHGHGVRIQGGVVVAECKSVENGADGPCNVVASDDDRAVERRVVVSQGNT
jgi:hypothetical protein